MYPQEMRSTYAEKRGLNKDSISLFLEELGPQDLLTAEQEVEFAKDIDNGKKATKVIEDFELDETVHSEMQKVVDKAEESRNTFVHANLPLVVSIARKFARGNVELDDLVQEGYFGLEDAIDHFDWTRGIRFSTFATLRIMAPIRNHYYENGHLVRFDSRPLETARKRLPPDDLDGDNFSPKYRQQNSLRRPLSLSWLVAGTGDNPTEFGDFLVDKDPPTDDQAIRNIEGGEEEMTPPLSMETLALLDILPKGVRRVVELRHGVLDGTPRSHQYVADELNKSKTSVMRQYFRGIKQMREAASLNIND